MKFKFAENKNASSQVLVRKYDKNNNYKHGTWVDVGVDINDRNDLLKLLQAVSWHDHCEDPYLIENELGFKGKMSAVRKISKLLGKRDLDDVHCWSQWTWDDTGVYNDKTIIDIRCCDYSKRWYKHPANPFPVNPDTKREVVELDLGPSITNEEMLALLEKHVA